MAPMLDARAILHRFAFLGVLCALVAPCSARGGTVSGKVVGVSDGDTITVLDSANTQHKIRLKGIDAPEKGQPFGQASKKHLSDLVFGKKVSVTTAGRPDKYGRELGTVYTGATDANAEMVASGFAWAYGDSTYSGLQAAARASRLGLWADSNPEKPEEYRKRRGIGYQSGGKKQKQAQAPPTAPQRIQTATTTRPARRWMFYVVLAAGVCGPIAIATVCKRLSR